VDTKTTLGVAKSALKNFFLSLLCVCVQVSFMSEMLQKLQQSGLLGNPAHTVAVLCGQRGWPCGMGVPS
jgi:hypothetical protein